MKRYLTIAASLLLAGTANGQTVKQAIAQTQGPKVTWTSGQERTTVRRDSNGRTSTSYSYTGPKVKVTYGAGSVGTVLQSDSSYVNMPRVSLDSFDPSAPYVARIDGKEIQTFPTWGEMPRARMRVLAERQGKTVLVFQGTKLIAAIEPN